MLFLSFQLCNQLTAKSNDITQSIPIYRPLIQDYPGGPIQKDETNLGFTQTTDSEWQWHQLGHMQACTSLQTQPRQHPTAQFLQAGLPLLPPNQQCQSTEEGK